MTSPLAITRPHNVAPIRRTPTRTGLPRVPRNPVTKHVGRRHGRKRGELPGSVSQELPYVLPGGHTPQPPSPEFFNPKIIWLHSEGGSDSDVNGRQVRLGQPARQKDGLPETRYAAMLVEPRACTAQPQRLGAGRSRSVTRHQTASEKHCSSGQFIQTATIFPMRSSEFWLSIDAFGCAAHCSSSNITPCPASFHAESAVAHPNWT